MSAAATIAAIAGALLTLALFTAIARVLLDVTFRWGNVRLWWLGRRLSQVLRPRPGRAKLALGLFSAGQGALAAYVVYLMLFALLHPKLSFTTYQFCLFMAALPLHFLLTTLRRAVLRSLEVVTALDPNGEVELLYLRSFADDVVRPSDIAFADCSDEEMLTHLMLPYGSLNAIASPHDDVPELGARRLRVIGEDWRSQVTLMARKSKIIVLRLDVTEGLLWELKMLIDNELLAKTVVLLPRPPEGDDEDLYVVMRAHIEATLGLKLPERQGRSRSLTRREFLRMLFGADLHPKRVGSRFLVFAGDSRARLLDPVEVGLVRRWLEAHAEESETLRPFFRGLGLQPVSIDADAQLLLQRVLMAIVAAYGMIWYIVSHLG